MWCKSVHVPPEMSRQQKPHASPCGSTKGPSWGYSVPVLGAVCPLLSTCGKKCPRLPKNLVKLTFEYTHEGPCVECRCLPLRPPLLLITVLRFVAPTIYYRSLGIASPGRVRGEREEKEREREREARVREERERERERERENRLRALGARFTTPKIVRSRFKLGIFNVNLQVHAAHTRCLSTTHSCYGHFSPFTLPISSLMGSISRLASLWKSRLAFCDFSQFPQKAIRDIQRNLKTLRGTCAARIHRNSSEFSQTLAEISIFKH